MANEIHLEIITPEKEVFNDMVESFIAPTIEGQVGVLKDHAPMVAVVDCGVFKYRKDGQEQKIALSNGLLELKNNHAQIMVPSAECAVDIDLERAIASAERARKRLEDKSAHIDHIRAEASLRRALARINTVK